MIEQPQFEKLKALIVKATDFKGEILGETELNEKTLGLDSVAVIQLVTLIEADFNVMLEPKEFMACKVVGDLYVLVLRNKAS